MNETKRTEYLYPADILLPDFEKVDGSAYSVIACDQFTSEPEYWNDAERLVGEAPSALRLVLPEIYLNSNRDARVAAINAEMDRYISSVLVSHPGSMILCLRTLPDGKVRRGIIASIDLDDYDYAVGSRPLIRATEGTVLERIPPRVEIRRGAAIELPHVMLLIDDPTDAVISSAADRCGEYEIAYDHELMLGGGHIKGYFIPKADQARVNEQLSALRAANPDGMLFAVGDGNHSLASAKAFYAEICEKLGRDAARSHPARYALTETVNIHDASLEFEPIYRTVVGADLDSLVGELTEYSKACGDDPANAENSEQKIIWTSGDRRGEVIFAHGSHPLPVGSLQKFLDAYLKEHPEVEIDYIHGLDSLAALSAEKDCIGFEFTGMEKGELFDAVERGGALPRKTFSMGEARSKRYYTEARRIK